MSRLERATNIAVNVAVLAFLAYALVAPEGLLAKKYARWRSERVTKATIERFWPALTASAPAGAKDVLVEFMDYQCPYCRSMYPVVAQWETGSGGTTLYVHVPRDEIHPFASAAATAAICAEEQGSFSTMNRYLNTNDSWMAADVKWDNVAAAGGVSDVDAFRQCLDSDRPLERLNHDRAIAEEIGVAGTPTFVSPHGIRRGAMPLIDLRQYAGGGM